MRVTEADALTKWCPFSRVYVFAPPVREGLPPPEQPGGPANRYVDSGVVSLNPDSCRCLASACMAWMWLGAEQEGASRLGFCGMAPPRA